MSSVKTISADIVVPPFLNPSSIRCFRDQLEQNLGSGVKFIILKGEKGTFCKGLDFNWISSCAKVTFTKDISSFYDIMNSLHSCGCITIAAVEGEVAGGGMGIVSACDVVIAGKNSLFSLPEGTLGIIPGIILPFLLNKLSQKQIRKMVFTGKKYSSQSMLEFDLVDDIVEEERLQESVQEMLKSMSSCKPRSIAELKQLLNGVGIPSESLFQKGLDNLKEKLDSAEYINRFSLLADYFREES